MLDAAERAGFEPATDLSARTRFPVAFLDRSDTFSEVAQRRGSAAGGEGFEPPKGLHPLTVFETAPFDRSGTS